MKRIISIISLFCFALAAYCEHDKTTYYMPDEFEHEGITLPFRQLELNGDKEGKYMLVIQLHGGTARGNDNTSQLNASAVDSVETYLRVHRSKAYFLLPQCGSDRVWNENSNSYSVTMTDVLKSWIDHFVSTHDVDTGRIYLTGYSAGGSGTWRMANDYPGLFAAVGVAAANPVMVTAAKVKSTPVYAIAGSADVIMDASRIENFVNSLIALGGDAKFDLLEGKDHFGTCDSAFSRERLAWIFGHSSSGVEPVADNGDDGNATVEARYDLSGRRVADGYQGIQIVRMTDGSVRKVANHKP